MSAQAEEAGEPTALYRTFGVEDALLYVGISKDFGYRWKQHAAGQPWWHEVQRQTVEWYPSREEAAAAEVAAIKTEKPKYNVMHAVRPALPPPPPDDPERVVPADGIWDIISDGSLSYSTMRLHLALLASPQLSERQAAVRLGLSRAVSYRAIADLGRGHDTATTSPGDRFQSVLNLPSNLNGRLLRMCIQAIADGGEEDSDLEHLLPGDYKEFIALAERAGIARSYKYKLYRQWVSPDAPA